MTSYIRSLADVPQTLRRLHKRGRPDPLSSLAPDLPCHIASGNSLHIQDVLLEEYGMVLAALDQQCLEFLIRQHETSLREIEAYEKLCKKGVLVLGKPYQEPKIYETEPNLAVEIKTLFEQCTDIKDGVQTIHPGYIYNLDHLKYWHLAKSVYFADPRVFTYDDSYYYDRSKDLLAPRLDHRMGDVTRLLLRTKARGLLGYVMRKAIRDRWTICDQITAAPAAGDIHTYTACIWPHMAEKLDATRIEDSREPMGYNSQATVSQPISLLLWVTFAANILLSIPTIAIGWQHSPHIPGTVMDADFWFLLQSCVSAVANLLILGLSLWGNRNSFSKGAYDTWAWIFTALGVIFALLAPVVYIRLPTEWSAFMIVTAGAVQAFLTLQMALMSWTGSPAGKMIKND